MFFIVDQSCYFYNAYVQNLQISKGDVYDALKRLDLDLDADTLISTLGLHEKDSIDFDHFAKCIFGFSEEDSGSDGESQFGSASMADLGYGLSQEELLVDDMVCIRYACTFHVSS